MQIPYKYLCHPWIWQCKYHIDTQWNKAVRRIWKLPSRARSMLLPHISKILPPSMIFLKSFVKFFINSMQSSNSIIKFVFQSALSNETRLGHNFRYILYKQELTINDFKQTNMDSDALCNLILRNWNISGDENSKKKW